MDEDFKKQVDMINSWIENLARKETQKNQAIMEDKFMVSSALNSNYDFNGAIL